MKNKAPRNKTILLTKSEEIAYAKQALKISPRKKINDFSNCVIWQDTFYALRFLPDRQRRQTENGWRTIPPSFC